MHISIQIPNLDKNGNSLGLHNFERVRDRIRGMMIDRFNKVTCVKGERFWKNHNGEVMVEEIEILSCHVDTNYMKHPNAELHGFMSACAFEVKMVLDQEEVFFTVDNSHFNYCG